MIALLLLMLPVLLQDHQALHMTGWHWISDKSGHSGQDDKKNVAFENILGSFLLKCKADDAKAVKVV